jgi:hypothetical protein
MAILDELADEKAQIQLIGLLTAIDQKDFEAFDMLLESDEPETRKKMLANFRGMHEFLDEYFKRQRK